MGAGIGPRAPEAGSPNMSRRRHLITAMSLLMLGMAGLTGCTSWLGTPANADPVPGGGSTGSPRGSGNPLLSDEEAAAIPVDSDIVYREVDGEQLTLDVCSPPDGDGADGDGPYAAVLLIHGGGFATGDKDGRPWQAICRWLANSGYVAVNLNYRLAPEHPFPAAIEDVQAAVEWTREHAQDYAIDPDRVGVLGGSAGANLAQLLGASGAGSATMGARVSAVVSLSGPSDLTRGALDLGTPDDRQISAVLDYLGCSDIDECPQAADASPITHVDATDPPFMLLHSRNERMPIEQAQAMADALSAVGNSPDLLIRPGHAHAVRLLAGHRVQTAVLDFLDRTLG
ncbi:MAG: alpha/beta hydrolase fold domain-containing protein [Geodermatophilaceae bacterium]